MELQSILDKNYLYQNLKKIYLEAELNAKEVE